MAELYVENLRMLLKLSKQHIIRYVSPDKLAKVLSHFVLKSRP